MYTKLFEFIRNEDVVLFLGAGFSLRSGYPSGYKLSNVIYNDLKRSERTHIRQNLGLTEMAEEYVQLKNNDREPLITLLKREFCHPPLNTKSQEILRSIPHFKTIITTNYDNTLESVYGDTCNIIINDSDCSSIDKNKVSILKVHGDLMYPESIIITRSDYIRYFDTQNNPILWNMVRAIMATKNILFIGYGYEDDNVESILFNINKSIGDKRKEMFLLAPSIPKHKVNRLHRYGITYIKSTGEDFLEQLIINIKENIKFDFDKKAVSIETFNRFCQDFKIQVTVTPEKKNNIINDIQPLAGSCVERKLEFVVSADLGNKIMSGDYNDISTDIPNFLGLGCSHLPSIKLTQEDFLNFRHTENGILFHKQSDISALWIIKQPSRHGIISITTPDGQIYPSMKYESYSLKDNRVKANIHTPIYTYNLDLNVTDGNLLTFNGTPEFENVYLDKETAIYWTKLLLYFSKGGNFKFNIDNIRFEQEIPFNESVVIYFQNVLDYYECIDKIERFSNERFKKYDSFSFERYENARKIFCYFNKSAYFSQTNNGKEIITIKQDSNSNLIRDLKQKAGPWMMCFSNMVEHPIVINDKEFGHFYQNSLFRNCSLIEINKIDDNESEIIIMDKENEIQVFFSDNPIKQEGNNILFK
ncbi:MAG: SIR2 family protein [Bacteroidales bacterium]|nr:SIR2 family protein [Bacteroidales bacterium]